MTLQININNQYSFKDSIADVLDICYTNLKNGYTQETKQQCAIMINLCKNILKTVPSNYNDFIRNYTLVFGIMFRGIIDFCDICNITHKTKWNEDHKKIEKTWVLMCDCNDRIALSIDYYESSLLNWILCEMTTIKNEFNNAFGNSLYFSPEIINIKPKCNICQLDCRACIHLAGNIYDGKLCRFIPEDVSVVSTSIVFEPCDPVVEFGHGI